MKKIISYILLLAMCVSLFAGCAKEPAGTTAPSTAAPTQPTQPTEPSQPAVNKLENARKYVFNMYKDNAEETRRDFSVITSLLVGEDSFNVSWAIEVVSGDPAAVVVLDNGDGTATVSIVDKEPVVEVVYNLVGTVSDNAGNTDTVSFSFMIPAVEATGITFVKTPEIGVAYKYAVQQNKLGKTLYLTGEMSGKYLATSDNVLDAVDVFVEEVEGGYHVYFMDGETKKFVNITTYTKDDGSESKTQSIGEEPTCVYQWDAERGTMYATISIGTFYLGTYNTYATISTSDVSYIQDISKIGESQFPAVFFDLNLPNEEIPADVEPTEPTEPTT